jgi:hypothetical protein
VADRSPAHRSPHHSHIAGIFEIFLGGVDGWGRSKWPSIIDRSASPRRPSLGGSSMSRGVDAQGQNGVPPRQRTTGLRPG